MIVAKAEREAMSSVKETTKAKLSLQDYLEREGIVMAPSLVKAAQGIRPKYRAMKKTRRSAPTGESASTRSKD